MTTINDQKSVKRDDDSNSKKGNKTNRGSQKGVEDTSGLTRGGSEKRDGSEKTEPDA
jgi:hypothetical protein